MAANTNLLMYYSSDDVNVRHVFNMNKRVSFIYCLSKLRSHEADMFLVFCTNLL